MTREEREIALYCLKASSDYHSEVCEECIKYSNCDHTMQDDVTETIVKALEQEPCEDAISRQAVLDHIYGIDGLEGLELSNVFEKHYADFIKSLPSVTPQPKTGHWIAVENEEMETVGYYCSECDLPMETENQTRFCPQCGSYNGGNEQ